MSELSHNYPHLRCLKRSLLESVLSAILEEDVWVCFVKNTRTEGTLSVHAIRQTMKAPENGELRIPLPNGVVPYAPIEVILIYGEPEDLYADKINALKAAMDDPLFQQDLTGIAGDFAAHYVAQSGPDHLSQ